MTVEYQPLTHEELIALATLYERIERWRVIKRMMESYYEPRARFVLVMEPEAGEGVPLNYEVQTAEHEQCPLDITLPWYQVYLEQGGEPVDDDTLDVWRLEDDIWVNLVMMEDMPAVNAFYDLLAPPTRENRDPEVYRYDPQTHSYVPVLLESVQKWATRYKEYEEWKQVFACVQTQYGPLADQVDVYASFDRKVGKNVIDDIAVYDAQGKQLLLDAVRFDQAIEQHLFEAWGVPPVTQWYERSRPPMQPSLPDLFRRSDAPFLP
jgi:hypothetical protein